MNISVRQLFALFWRSIKIYKTSFFLTLLSVFLASNLELIVPLYYKKFFDAVSASGASSAIIPALTHTIVVILILNGFIWFFYRAGSFAVSRFDSYVIADLKQKAFDYLTDHSYGFFTNTFVGSLVQKVDRYARSFERVSDRLVWNMMPLVVRIVGIAIGLWFFNRVIMAIVTIWAVIFIIFNYFFSVWKLKYDIIKAESDSLTTGTLADAITNHNTIQLFTGAEAESNIFREVSNKQRDVSLFSWNLGNALEAIQGLLIVAVEFLLFYFSIRYWAIGKLSVGTFVLIQAYLMGLVGRLWDFNRVIRDLYESFADAKEMAEILFLPHEIRDVPTATPIKVTGGAVVFKNVQFYFNQTRPVLRGINFTVKPGEKVGLVGPSGAGKSTIARLLFRFYEIQGGKIMIDGQDIQRGTLESLRENISLVPQDPVLFHRTIRDNIRYGKRDATDAEVERAAKLAHCDEFIDNLSLKYETFVGERGIKLSGGERQRVAIARAMLKNAPILVLDEATSSLDSHSEALIQDALDVLMKGRTTIVIAHRLSTIRKMDRIIVIDEGKITEEGAHDDLLIRPNGLYRKLWTLQAGGFLYEEYEEGKEGEKEREISEI